MLRSDLHLHDVFAVMEFRTAHRGRPGRDDAWQQAPPVQLHDPAAHQCVGRCRIRGVAATIDDQDPEAASRHQHGGRQRRRSGRRPPARRTGND